MRSKILAALFMLYGLAPAAEASVILTATQTANLTNDGGWMANTPWPGGFGGQYLTVNWGAGYYNYGLMQFDLSSVAGTVKSAKLAVFHDLNVDPAAVFGVFRNTQAWDMNTTTFNSAPAYDSTPAATRAINNLATGQWEYFDVTGLAKGWKDGTFANDGVSFIRTDAMNPTLYFVGAGSNAPGLEIETEVPEPATLVVFAAGAAGALGRRRRRARDR